MDWQIYGYPDCHFVPLELACFGIEKAITLIGILGRNFGLVSFDDLPDYRKWMNAVYPRDIYDVFSHINYDRTYPGTRGCLTPYQTAAEYFEQFIVCYYGFMSGNYLTEVYFSHKDVDLNAIPTIDGGSFNFDYEYEYSHEIYKMFLKTLFERKYLANDWSLVPDIFDEHDYSIFDAEMRFHPTFDLFTFLFNAVKDIRYIGIKEAQTISHWQRHIRRTCYRSAHAIYDPRAEGFNYRAMVDGVIQSINSKGFSLLPEGGETIYPFVEVSKAERSNSGDKPIPFESEFFPGVSEIPPKRIFFGIYQLAPALEQSGWKMKNPIPVDAVAWFARSRGTPPPDFDPDVDSWPNIWEKVEVAAPGNGYFRPEYIVTHDWAVKRDEDKPNRIYNPIDLPQLDYYAIDVSGITKFEEKEEQND